MTSDCDDVGEPAGPVERIPLPEKLTARVVEPGPVPRIFGYAVADDLAINYSFAETLLLSLSGALPDAAAGKAFEVALTFAAPISVADAPSNAAGLAKLCAAASKNVIGVGAVLLAERAASRLAELDGIFPWLEDPTLPFPHAARASSSVALVSALRGALPPSFAAHPVFDRDPILDGALVAIFHACGLRRPERVLSAYTIAGLGCTVAEAFAVKSLNLRGYPMNLPPFVYEEP
ncbi:hypothetical protein BH09MYX1_BH09MYX1_43510 [soil metagenome]